MRKWVALYYITHRGHWYFMWPCVLVLLNLCHQGQVLLLVLLVLLSCICAKFFSFRVMLLLGFSHIHPGCLEICLGDSERNKSISVFCKTYCLYTLSPCSVLSIRAVTACFRKVKFLYIHTNRMLYWRNEQYGYRTQTLIHRWWHLNEQLYNFFQSSWTISGF